MNSPGAPRGWVAWSTIAGATAGVVAAAFGVDWGAWARACWSGDPGCIAATPVNAVAVAGGAVLGAVLGFAAGRAVTGSPGPRSDGRARFGPRPAGAGVVAALSALLLLPGALDVLAHVGRGDVGRVIIRAAPVAAGLALLGALPAVLWERSRARPEDAVSAEDPARRSGPSRS